MRLRRTVAGERGLQAGAQRCLVHAARSARVAIERSSELIRSMPPCSVARCPLPAQPPDTTASTATTQLNGTADRTLLAVCSDPLTALATSHPPCTSCSFTRSSASYPLLPSSRIPTVWFQLTTAVGQADNVEPTQRTACQPETHTLLLSPAYRHTAYPRLRQLLEALTLR